MSRNFSQKKIHKLLSLLGLIFFQSSVLAHEGPHKHPEGETHKPTPVPDRITLCVTQDPSASMAVNWRTDLSVAQGLVEYTVSQAGPMFIRSPKRIDATNEVLKSDLSEARYHSAVMKDLKPETVYAYRVGDGLNWSEWFQFRTPSNVHKPFKFIYFGDAQNDVKSMWSRVIRSAFQDASRAGLIIHAGDLINSTNKDAEWGDWFGAAGFINGMLPIMPTPGNHEYGKSTDGPKLSNHWRPQFTLPANGPEGLEESCYFIDYSGVRFVSLNSNVKQEEQARWLESVLAKNPNRWTVLTFHHPIYSPARGRDNAKLRDLWQPIFDKYRVDLVLTGHDHTYARSGPRVYDNVPSGGTARDAKSGTVYVVSVSGPKMYKVEKQPWMRRAAENTQLYQIIEIDGDKLKYESRTAIGTLYDAFELIKKDGQPNEMIDKIPDGPERIGEEVKTSHSLRMDAAKTLVR